jgi:hypothetical protein
MLPNYFIAVAVIIVYSFGIANQCNLFLLGNFHKIVLFA